MNKADERISFSTATWITLISLIVGGVAANIMLIYNMSGNVQDRIDKLDLRWQDRTTQMSTRLEKKIDNVADQIPPDWFRSMVEKNSQDIEKLEEFIRTH